MTAMLGIDLREAENFAVGKWASKAFRQLTQIVFLVSRKGKAFAFVICRDVVDIYNWSRRVLGLESGGAEVVVDTLEHRVVRGIPFGSDTHKLFDTRNAAETHVLGNLNGIGAPRSNHFFTGAYETAFESLGCERLCTFEQPREAVNLIACQLMVRLHEKHLLAILLEESNHI